MEQNSASTARTAPVPPEGCGLLPFTEAEDGKVELVAELRPEYDEEFARKQERRSLVHGFALLAAALLVTAGVALISGAHGSLGEEIIERKVLAYALFFGEMACIDVMRRAVVNFRTSMILGFLAHSPSSTESAFQSSCCLFLQRRSPTDFLSPRSHLAA